MAEAQTKKRRQLDAMVHQVLLFGGGLAALLLLSAVIAAVIERQPLAHTALSPREAWESLRGLHAGGLASVGLLILIFTPVVRVVGSVVVFIVERDYRYALVTFTVLSLMLAGFLLGHG